MMMMIPAIFAWKRSHIFVRLLRAACQRQRPAIMHGSSPSQYICGLISTFLNAVSEVRTHAGRRSSDATVPSARRSFETSQLFNRACPRERRAQQAAANLITFFPSDRIKPQPRCLAHHFTTQRDAAFQHVRRGCLSSECRAVVGGVSVVWSSVCLYALCIKRTRRGVRSLALVRVRVFFLLEKFKYLHNVARRTFGLRGLGICIFFLWSGAHFGARVANCRA